MSSKNLKTELRLKTILEAIAKIERYTACVDEFAFQNNDEKVDAVCMQLIVVGDNTYELRDFLEKTSEAIPWLKVGNLRHLLAHHYAKMNPTLIWTIVQDDLPSLKAAIDRIVASHRQDP